MLLGIQAKGFRHALMGCAILILMAPLSVIAESIGIVTIPQSGSAVADSGRHEHPDALQAARLGGSDADGDGKPDYADNCSQIANSDQYDSNGDGYGNACDADIDNNDAVNFADLQLLADAFFGVPGSANFDPDADLDGNDLINFADLQIMSDLFFTAPGPSGMSCAGTVPCPEPQLIFDWPMPGSDGSDWVINNYVDVEPGSAVRDYVNGSKTYDGHRGVDIDVATFREMDNDFPILAAAQGIVLALEDGNFDRNTSCTGSWNFVTVGHPNGWQTIYGHLKQSSVVVSVGQLVEPGDVLGVVGSSGCSTQPHLHLETLDEDGNFVSPFELGMWSVTPVYNTLISFMDATLYNQAISNVGMIKDPPPNVTTVPAGTTFGVGLSMAGGLPGDAINLRILKDTATVASHDINFTALYRHTYWWWNSTFSAAASGTHQLQILLNGILVETYDVDVTPSPQGLQQVRHGVPSGSYQGLFNNLVAKGYRPIWVDGYDVNGSTFFNVIYDQSAVTSWVAAHGQTDAQYQSFFDSQVAAGRRLAHIDTYLEGGQTRHASIFVEQIGSAWAAYHSVTAATHQAQFNSLVSQGFRVAIISSVEVSGTQRFSALYDRDPVGAWVALANLSDSQYQTEFTNQTNAGRTLAYLNVYTLNGVPRFSAIWNSLVPTTWVARHNLSSDQFQGEFDNWVGNAGLNTRIVTGYERNNVANFGALWTD